MESVFGKLVLDQSSSDHRMAGGSRRIWLLCVPPDRNLKVNASFVGGSEATFGTSATLWPTAYARLLADVPCQCRIFSLTIACLAHHTVSWAHQHWPLYAIHQLCDDCG